MQGNMFTT